MDTQTNDFNANQFRRAGLAEAYTPELRQKMERGDREIQHFFPKKYEGGDQVNAVLHLRKRLESLYNDIINY